MDSSALAKEALDHERIWATYALSYDKVLPRLDFYQEVVARHVAALSDDAIGTVIDIGAGTGSVALPLLLYGHAITCVDNSHAMLDRLRAKLPAGADDRIVIACQTAEDLSCPDASFDGVNILLALFDMVDPRAALDHAMRVLRPGGVFIATEPKWNFDMKDLLAHAEQCLRDQGLFERLQPHWRRVYDVNRTIDPAKRLSSLRIEEILAVLDNEGFCIQSVRDSHHGNCATVLARKALAASE